MLYVQVFVCIDVSSYETCIILAWVLEKQTFNCYCSQGSGFLIDGLSHLYSEWEEENVVSPDADIQ